MARTEGHVFRRLIAGLLAAMLVMAACGDDDDGPADDDATIETPTSDAAGDTVEDTTVDVDQAELDADAPDHGRVVALAEEFLLADLLTLGIEPIASSATVDAVGFQGLDDFDTGDIEVLPQLTLSIEYLASLQPDTIVTLQYWVDQIGADVLEGMGEVVVIPDGVWGPERIELLGDLLDRPQHAAAAVEAYEAALATAQAEIPDDCVVSLATIYAGPSVAAFVDGPWEMPSSIQSVGCTLDPGPDVAEGDQNGRAWLSMEEVDILDSDTLILLQSTTVEGEDDAIAEVEADRLWQTLPAVQADQVIVFDRLGYPGLQGQIHFLAELADALSS